MSTADGTTKGQAALPQPDLMYRLELNCSWW